MTAIKWERVDTLRGDGSITHSATKETLPVGYLLEIWQEVLEPVAGTRYQRQKEIHGSVKPAPQWPITGHFAILHLADGRHMKCWLENYNGQLTGSGEFVQE
jgi:hypothetical protein